MFYILQAPMIKTNQFKRNLQIQNSMECCQYIKKLMIGLPKPVKDCNWDGSQGVVQSHVGDEGSVTIQTLAQAGQNKTKHNYT